MEVYHGVLGVVAVALLVLAVYLATDKQRVVNRYYVQPERTIIEQPRRHWWLPNWRPWNHRWPHWGHHHPHMQEGHLRPLNN